MKRSSLIDMWSTHASDGVGLIVIICRFYEIPLFAVSNLQHCFSSFQLGTIAYSIFRLLLVSRPGRGGAVAISLQQYVNPSKNLIDLQGPTRYDCCQAHSFAWWQIPSNNCCSPCQPMADLSNRRRSIADHKIPLPGSFNSLEWCTSVFNMLKLVRGEEKLSIHM